MLNRGRHLCSAGRPSGWALAHILVLFTLFLGSRPARTGGPILTIYTSYDVFLRKEVPFGGLDEIAPHLGGQIPQKKTILGA